MSSTMLVAAVAVVILLSHASAMVIRTPPAPPVPPTPSANGGNVSEMPAYVRLFIKWNHAFMTKNLTEFDLLIHPDAMGEMSWLGTGKVNKAEMLKQLSIFLSTSSACRFNPWKLMGFGDGSQGIIVTTVDAVGRANSTLPTKLWSSWDCLYFLATPDGRVGFYGEYLPTSPANETQQIAVVQSLINALVDKNSTSLANVLTDDFFLELSIGNETQIMNKTTFVNIEEQNFLVTKKVGYNIRLKYATANWVILSIDWLMQGNNGDSVSSIDIRLTISPDWKISQIFEVLEETVSSS